MMDQELTRIEAELASLKPLALPDDFLLRLESAMEEAADEVAESVEEVIVPALGAAQLTSGTRSAPTSSRPTNVSH